MRRWIAIVPLMIAAAAQGALVHAYQETLAGGVRTQLSDETKETGVTYTTQSAPTLDGYIFTHWLISTAQSFTNRDRLGRAKDAAPYTPYEETTLTANYLPQSEDTDNDGVADGWEIYWYGDLSKDAASDTDGDGYTFAEELAAGTNPLMVDESIAGGIAWVDGELLQYNPDNLQAYTIRSEPEGSLFATTSGYLTVGAAIPIPSVGASFAYWMVDGVRQADRLGRAKDTLSVAMPPTAIEIVAVSESDEARRNALYWYGDASVAKDSDTDGDGYTFAEELAAGTNPLMFDRSLSGGIVWADGGLLQYNPYNIHPYTIRSEPEGALFATVSDYMEAGSIIKTPSVGNNFAYWMVNGTRQADRYGRAKDSLSIAMPETELEIIALSESDTDRRKALYWYGDDSVSQDSDTDGDGYTFAEELAAGTNPLMFDRSLAGGIVWADGSLLETDLQVYEQATGAWVDGEHTTLFTSPIAGNSEQSMTFGENLQPIVWDVDGDGLFDLVLIYNGGYRIFKNVGVVGSPEFEESVALSTNEVDIAMNSADRLSMLHLDVPAPADALSATSFGSALLVSDSAGRIWYYESTTPDSNSNYILQHKVWGGSRPGFADGLLLAAVDWDGDGDLDCLVGTSDGKLMLLIDPRIGRPAGLKAQAGATDVVLTWNASVSSRLRGYGIYRGIESNNCAKIENCWPLPRYRDEPPTLADQYYRVTSKSRFYRAGNSEPIESETDLSDAVLVSFGGVEVWMRDTSSFTCTNVSVVVSMNNSMGLSSDGFSMRFRYDSSVLEPVEMKPTGLTDGLMFGTGTTEDAWTIAATGGEIAVGSGRFLELVFRVKDVHDVTETAVTLDAATIRTVAGQTVSVALPQSAKIEISDANPLVPAIVSLSMGNVAVDTLTEFVVPVTITSNETLTNFEATVVCGSTALEYRGESPIVFKGTVPSSFNLTFYAKDQHDITSATVALTSISAVDNHGLVANPIADASATVLIHDANPLMPAKVAIGLSDAAVKSGGTVEIPLTLTCDGEISEVRVRLEWTEDMLTMVLPQPGATSGSTFAFGSSGSFVFAAANIPTLSASATVSVTEASGTSANGLPAEMATVLPVAANVLVSREIGRYSSGDVNGDGQLTDADAIRLAQYLSYLAFPSFPPLKQYDLVGEAKAAADVNCDGTVDENDVSLLQTWLAELSGGAQ